MAELTDLAIQRALARGAEAVVRETRALDAHFDAAQGRVVINLTNGCTLAVPTALCQGLEGAGPADLAQVQVAGSGLHWPSLDVDLSVPGLVAGLFGSRNHMARLAGRTTSPAKAAAARANGALGGRPRKIKTVP
jgi:hypothetical protein